MDLDAAFASLPGLTTRGAQRTMASAVATALEREQPLLVHAPTGVGKSLGYLVPIAAAGRRAIVATATKALQSQLIDRDLPRLADAFQTTSALLMGRGNYVCLAKVDALVAATRLAATAQEEAALQVVDWAVDSDSGSRLDAPPGTRDDVWDLISTPGEDCPGQKGCSFFKRCFAERAKEQARDVDVVVTNHHLLLLELELRQASDSPGVMLPEVDVVVVDEAHRLADHAADLYGVTVTGARVSRAGAAADAIIKASGSTPDWARRLRARWGDRIPTTVACSATLAVAGELGGTAAALGVERPDGLVAESPFDFRGNALLYVPRGVPAPTGDGFQAAAERELRGLVEASEGRALVLCTSWRAVESFAAALADLPWELLVQGEDTPARLAARFRDEVASVLVATRTFFEGGDVPGQSLSLLVLDRLPFPRPDDPTR